MEISGRLAVSRHNSLKAVALNSDFTVDGDAGTGLVSGYSVAVDKVVEVRSTLDRDIAIAATVLPPLCTTL